MMPNNQHDTERIPRFRTIQEAAEFWDKHSSLDFPEEFEDDEVELENPYLRRVLEIALSDDHMDELITVARKLNTPVADLARQWVMEKLADTLAGDNHSSRSMDRHDIRLKNVEEKNIG